jgi:hypothetical protein
MYNERDWGRVISRTRSAPRKGNAFRYDLIGIQILPYLPSMPDETVAITGVMMDHMSEVRQACRAFFCSISDYAH